MGMEAQPLLALWGLNPIKVEMTKVIWRAGAFYQLGW